MVTSKFSCVLQLRSKGDYQFSFSKRICVFLVDLLTGKSQPPANKPQIKRAAQHNTTQHRYKRAVGNKVRGGKRVEIYSTISVTFLPTSQGKSKYFHFRKQHVRCGGVRECIESQTQPATRIKDYIHITVKNPSKNKLPSFKRTLFCFNLANKTENDLIFRLLWTE